MAAGGAATEAEDDGMPKEDPSKLERAAGEEDEEVRSAVVAKLTILAVSYTHLTLPTTPYV